jgi:hypothetical protein
LASARGGAIRLDGMQVKRAIFKDTEIYYAGGPLELEYVLFVDCKLIFENGATERRLAGGMLATNWVAFNARS